MAEQIPMQLWRGLQVGDRVIMLRAKAGNLYYVLQREGPLNAANDTDSNDG